MDIFAETYIMSVMGGGGDWLFCTECIFIESMILGWMNWMFNIIMYVVLMFHTYCQCFWVEHEFRPMYMIDEACFNVTSLTGCSTETQ